MKMIGLFLSSLLVFLSTFEDISFAVSIEKSSQKAIECAFEKKQSENLADETKLLPSEMSNALLKDETISVYQNTFYVQVPTHTLFRPPISA